MTGINTRILRAFARVYKRNADTAAKSLSEYLLDRLTARVCTVEEGRLLIGLSNAELGSSNWSPTGELAQTRILETISDLADRYDQAQTDLVTDGATTLPQPDAIYTRMFTDIVPVREAFQDGSGLRCM